MSEAEDLIYGKNAVLSFLEQSLGGLGDNDSDEPANRRNGQLDWAPKIRVNKILIANGLRPDGRIGRIQELARKFKVPVNPCDRRKLDQMMGGDIQHQGIVAIVSPAEFWQLDTFIKKIELDKEERQRQGKSMDGYMVAVLDGIEDPHNLGAIIRVAESSGVKGLLVGQYRSAGLTGTVAKISAGALAHLPVVRVSNLVQTLEALKKVGFWIVGLDAHGVDIYTKADLNRPLAIVIGSEGKGIGRLVKEHCDFLVKIPMLGKTESLNASVASGVFFYEVVRQST
jgi:23S rRNA (guanosine2251-2'-O)-methyltransferase